MIYNNIYIIIYIFENPRLLGECYKATEPINWGSTFRGVGIVDSSACGCMVSSIESAPAQGQQPTPPERHRVAMSFATCKRSFTTNDNSWFIITCICNYTYIYIYTYTYIYIYTIINPYLGVFRKLWIGLQTLLFNGDDGWTSWLRVPYFESIPYPTLTNIKMTSK